MDRCRPAVRPTRAPAKPQDACPAWKGSNDQCVSLFRQIRTSAWSSWMLASDAALLYRDRLRQIARLVNVAAATHADVIRQQLQRHDLKDRQQELRRGRNINDVVGGARDLFVACHGNS